MFIIDFISEILCQDPKPWVFRWNDGFVGWSCGFSSTWLKNVAKKGIFGKKISLSGTAWIQFKVGGWRFEAGCRRLISAQSRWQKAGSGHLKTSNYRRRTAKNISSLSQQLSVYILGYQILKNENAIQIPPPRCRLHRTSRHVRTINGSCRWACT